MISKYIYVPVFYSSSGMALQVHLETHLVKNTFALTNRTPPSAPPKIKAKSKY